jgi:hypothetical protein
MPHLAIFGGDPVRTKPYPAWPVFDESEERAILGVLRSGQMVARTPGGVELSRRRASKPLEDSRIGARLRSRHGCETLHCLRQRNRRTRSSAEGWGAWARR